jgi:hypothetical protein
MAVIPHTPYAPNLAPCDFVLFPKMTLKLKGRRFDTIEEIQAESQRVLDTLTEQNFRKPSNNAGTGGIGVYMREGTTSRVMAADSPYGDFHSVSPYFMFCKSVNIYKNRPDIESSQKRYSNPIRACTDPEGSRKMRRPDCKIIGT